MSLIQTARTLSANDSFAVEMEQTVYALDTTTIDLCLSVFPWARFRQAKAAVKMHTLLDLPSNIAAEDRAKIVYDRLIGFTDDQVTIDALQFLMTRDITHMKAFTAALESMGKPAFSIGRIPPTPGLVDQYFNDSTGTGDRGEPDAKGPWNQGRSEGGRVGKGCRTRWSPDH